MQEETLTPLFFFGETAKMLGLAAFIPYLLFGTLFLTNSMEFYFFFNFRGVRKFFFAESLSHFPGLVLWGFGNVKRNSRPAEFPRGGQSYSWGKL